MKVLAIDPGVTTGIAYGVIEDGIMTVAARQVKFNHEELWAHLMVQSPAVIVCESFEFRQGSRKGLELYPVELIGVIKLYGVRGAPVELEMQSAAKGKGYYKDAILKKHGVYVAGKPHGMDALRHLLHWFTFGPGYKYNVGGFV